MYYYLLFTFAFVSAVYTRYFRDDLCLISGFRITYISRRPCSAYWTTSGFFSDDSRTYFGQQYIFHERPLNLGRVILALNHKQCLTKHIHGQKLVTSNIGTYLFKNVLLSDLVKNQSRKDFFNVLIWKHWPWLKFRHADAFYKARIDPLHGCSVTNCRFTGDLDFAAADAVVIHLQKGNLPNVTSRDPSQLWIFWVDESPDHAFSLARKKPSYSNLSNIFNWSMTYRLESDIPIPYGRIIPLSYPKVNIATADRLEELVPYWNSKQTDVLATILMSNCFNPRLKSLINLRRYLKIDVFGNCATDGYNKKRCPGGFWSDCKVIPNYFFYIVMENSKCRQYITEKVFHHAYGKGAIPVIVGPPVADCMKLLPPNSFLHVDNFKTLKDLALEIIDISKNLTKLLSYHAWRNHFEVLNEHGYFGTRSSLLCRICEGLNYNDRSRKVYDLDDIRRYLDPNMSCTKYEVYK